MRIGTRGIKKKAAVAVAAIVVVGGSLAAYAYYTASSASDTENGAVGSAASWSIVVGAFGGDPALYPGQGTQTATYTVTNTGSGNQRLTAMNASVADAGGCLGSWFTVAAGNPASGFGPTGTSITPGNSTTGTVTLQLKDEPVNQDACKLANTPVVTVTAS